MEHDAGGEDEGRVIAGDDERDEGVEADRGADVDEGEEEVDGYGCGDRVQRQRSAAIDLAAEV